MTSVVPKKRAGRRDSRADRPAVYPDPAGMERALRIAAMPKNLLIPIAASSREAIQAHVGTQAVDLPGTRFENALLVQPECGPGISNLRVWQHHNAGVLNANRQMWVRPKYGGYRRAYRLAFPDADIRGTVIHHIMNRRYATLHGFEYVRVLPISRSNNSSSGFSENWGVQLTKDGTLRSRKGLEKIGYADLAHVMSMLDIRIGGGVMEEVRLAVNLLKPVEK